MSAIVAADYFSDTTDVTVKVIDAQKITDADAKTIAENLSAYPEELTLTVTPDSDADLTSASTDGTIVITYLDAEGASQAITLTFADASKTTAQMTKLPAGATITEVESMGWDAGTFDITTAIAGNIVRNPEPIVRVSSVLSSAKRTLAVKSLCGVCARSDSLRVIRSRCERC